LKPAWGNHTQHPILKKPSLKRTGRVAQGVGPEFKPHYHTHTHTHTKSCGIFFHLELVAERNTGVPEGPLRG
jgi:hypothetical protein